MAYPAIFTAALCLLLAFGVERLGRSSGIPSVILLILLGLLGKPVLAALGVALSGLDGVVPLLGAVGLVLIVLEGALDIELRRDRLRAAAGAGLLAVAGFGICLAVFASLAVLALSMTPFQALILAVPFAVISSAVAIPGSSFLPPAGREFVVYESSISDILGVMVFFALVGSDGTLSGIAWGLLGGGALSLLLAVVCTLTLVAVLIRIDGHIRFIPLLAGLFGLYAAGKMLHLSPLILVLLFGLALNNPSLLGRFPPFSRWIDDRYEATLKEFKVLTMELTFAVRGFFFLLLGYWTELSDLAHYQAWLSAALVLATIYASRSAMLRLERSSMAASLTWLAPRGLITVLLFLNAREVLALPDYAQGTVMLVVLVSAALMTLGRPRQAPAGAVTNGG